MLLSACLEQHEQISKEKNPYDIFFTRDPPLHDGESFLPYLGNGYVSVIANDKSNLYLKQGRTVGLKVPYKPFFSATVKSHNKKAISLNIYNGTVHQYHCYKTGNKQFTMEETFYAHRTIPSLLVQQILINHPSYLYTQLDVTNNNEEFSGQSRLDIQLSTKMATVNVVSRLLTQHSTTYLVLILQSNSSHGGHIKSLPEEGSYLMGATSAEQRPVLQTYLTYVTYEALASDDDVIVATKALADTSIQKFTKILETDYNELREQHTRAWNELWSSGFGISKSLAQDSINGDRINKTLYYLLSSVRHYLLEHNHSPSTTPQPSYSPHHHPSSSSSFSSSEEAVQKARESLHKTDRCYAGPHTLQSDKLWMDIGSMEEMITCVEVWIITLEKNGCAQMLNAGAEGLLQSVVLSLGGLRFGHKHLEMAIHPRDLHRDLQFRRINYDSNTHLTISVRVGEDNRAVLYVSLDRSNSSFYACDAGCLDPPMLLSKKEVSLPVKLTSPVTSILYIAPDLQHINELKLAIHVQSIDHAPAHEHDLLALHRHGHRWGGLPLVFWLVLGALIVIFHLFLFKLVYNEYCKNQELRGFTSGRQYKYSDSGYPSQKVTMYGHQRRFA